MTDLVALGTGTLYRGVVIYTDAVGAVFIFGETGLRYDFIDAGEAEAFVDAALAMSGLMLIHCI